MLPDWIAAGLIDGTFWVGIGLTSLYLARNWLRRRIFTEVREITGYLLAEIMQDVHDNPQKLQPMVDALMGQFLNRPGGILPKEATVRLPVIGKVPASWLEPFIKKHLGKLAGDATEEVAKKVLNPFG